MPDRNPPREIPLKQKAYAFERSLGIPPAEACRRAGGKVEDGRATVWERSERVQAWIRYYRSQGCDDEMIEAKRARIEERLAMAAFGNIFDFATITTATRPGVAIADEQGVVADQVIKRPEIDWEKIANSPYAAIISGFKFDKDTGELVDFERDNALQALMQLRDMHGFRAPKKTELSGANGGPVQIEDALSLEDRGRALAMFLEKAQREQKVA